MPYRHLDVLHEEFAAKRSAVRARLAEFRRVPEERYFYELLYCLMTPQSSAVNAGRAQQRFEELRYRDRDADPLPVLFDKTHYIRFHRTKALRIAEMKERYHLIAPVVTGPLSAAEKREWLVRNVKGMSLKEATHFLRNVGRNDGLAILDRHILRNLRRHGVIRSVPSVLTPKRYLAVERAFGRFSRAVGITTDELDLLFWSREAGEILK